MDRSPVSSSQIHSIGYDAANKKMEIEFHSHVKDKPRSVYEYSNVQPHDHERLISAPSIGSHFGKNIKAYPARFPYKRIGG